MPNSNKNVGRPKSPLVKRVASGFKTSATGETRNSPTTDPNIIFWVGAALILLSSWSSGRLQTIIKASWFGFEGNKPAPSTTDFVNAIKTTVSLVLFLWIITIIARAFPKSADVLLLLVMGFGLLWIIKNPQIVQMLANWAQPIGTNSSSNSPITGGTSPTHK